MCYMICYVHAIECYGNAKEYHDSVIVYYGNAVECYARPLPPRSGCFGLLLFLARVEWGHPDILSLIFHCLKDNLKICLGLHRLLQ